MAMKELTGKGPPPKRASVASAAVIEGKDSDKEISTPVEEHSEKAKALD